MTKKNNPSAKISIIIPNYNGGNTLFKCLNSLIKNLRKFLDAEIILVDNASDDNSANQAKSKFPKIKLIKLRDNLGFSKAVNVGIRKAFGDYLFILNNDAILKSNCLWELTRILSQKKEYGIAGPRIVNLNGAYDRPGLKIFTYLGFIRWGPKGYNQPHDVDWISGCAMMIKRTVIKKIGLFDENFFFYSEDSDFCIRAKKAGFKLIYQPKATIVHYGGISSQAVDRNLIHKYWYQGKFRYLFKHGNPLQILTSLFLQILVFPYKVLIRRDGTGMAQIRGLLWAIKHQ